MGNKITNTKISKEDLETIRHAKQSMQDIGLLMKGFDKFGNAIEIGIKKLPQKMQEWLQELVNKTLLATLKGNLLTLQKDNAFKKPSNKTYKTLVTTTGVLSGAFGSTTGVGTAIFASELAISTKFMMRSIMDIARSHGEDLYNPDTQLACLQVFAFGGTSKQDDSSETGYYANRIALKTAIKEASKFIAQNGIKDLSKVLMVSSNPLLKLIGTIASRFSIQVSEKFIAQAVPVVGAVGGGTFNLVFINHFQNIAKAHFTMRALERKYSNELVMKTYNDLVVK